MQRKKQAKNLKKPSSIRASISFPADIYETLEDIAKQKKVSLGWVVREAAETYLADKWPLFRTQVQSGSNREK
jgi:hypothetical protein